MTSDQRPRSLAAARPTGTVTFLFTDIEGSTQRWERDRDAMSAALTRHDEILRDAIVDHGGFLFKTVGDAFCAAFATAGDAAAAAIGAQRALDAADFGDVGGVRVRAALHTGAADERGGDYFGPAVNRVARLLAIGHGGQILLSQTTTDLLQGELPGESRLRDLGAHRLRDLANPEHVYQVDVPGLPQTFPALRSLGGFPNNLPSQLTSFVGREGELAEIKALLLEHRLVTLVGTGGAGKTRCALAAGADLLERFNDGVWFVELAPISDPALVPACVARALGVRESTDRALIDSVLAYLERRDALLVVDNCEHVIDAAREAIAAMLRGCPGLHVLATSRETLNCAGEHSLRLPSLAVPAARERSARAVHAYGAVTLFADRAVASDATFALTDENAPFVAEIARRLDGIPLALELAAARVKVLSPQQLAQRLNERFRVLTGGDRSALPRHQTMRALIDWSHDLLSEPERTLFRKLSIFAGGFSLDRAVAVCGDDATDEFAILDLLSSLVDKSLVQADPGAQRYRLLESTRQYAHEKLRESGEHDRLAGAHAAAFLALAEHFDDVYNTTPDAEWYVLVEPELENWRTALDWALTGRADVLTGQRLTAALSRIWAFLGPIEGRRWLLSALELVDDTTPETVVALLDLVEAQIDGILGLHGASYEAARRALTRYAALNDSLGVAQAQRHAGRGLVFLGRVDEGEALLREALAQFDRLGNRVLAAAATENLAVARNASGDTAGARRLYSDALAIFKETGAERLAVALATNLAEAEFHDGNAETALALVSEALATDRTASFTYRTALLMCNTAAYLLALHRFDDARAAGREALEKARELHYQVAVTWALQHLAAIAALRPRDDDAGPNDTVRAARLLGFVDHRLGKLGIKREYTEQQEYDATLRALEAVLGAEHIAAEIEEGRGWGEDRAAGEGMLV
jgi:predicted ATPase/class 3 adenylate cyclase